MLTDEQKQEIHNKTGAGHALICLVEAAATAPLLAQIAALTAQLAEARKETGEQARLNGMGAEREALLMAENAELKAKLAENDALRELLRESLEALTCGDTGDDLEDSHRCGRCDEYVDRNAKLRMKIRAALAREQGGSDAPEA